MMEDTLNQLTDWLNAYFTQVANKSLTCIMESLDDDHDMALVFGSLRRATRSMPTSMLNDERVRDAFKTAVIQMASSGLMVLPTANALVKKQSLWHLLRDWWAAKQ